jgi:hypothetical protein
MKDPSGTGGTDGHLQRLFSELTLAATVGRDQPPGLSIDGLELDSVSGEPNPKAVRSTEVAVDKPISEQNLLSCRYDNRIDDARLAGGVANDPCHLVELPLASIAEHRRIPQKNGANDECRPRIVTPWTLVSVEVVAAGA